MQYAQVVVNTKTDLANDVFTYKISPKDLLFLKPGILVSVPFHGRNLEGIVVDLKKSLPAGLAPEKLKQIKNILDPIPVVDEIHLKLAQWMSQYYLAPLGITLFENIVPIAKRQAKAISSQLRRFRSESDRIVGPIVINQKSNPKSPIANCPKPILINADFETRFKFYLKAIKRTINHKRQAIVIVPDLSYLAYFKKYLPPKKIIVLSSSMTLTQRYIAWQEIRSGKYPIILGSTSALFAPANNLGLIICDQEESAFYKSDQSPRWRLPDVAKKLSDLSNTQLILGSITPSIESYYQAKNGKYRLFNRPISKTPVNFTDLSKSKQIISYELEEAIGATLQNKGKVILYVNRKGEGRILACPDCGHTFLCQKCQNPLTPNANQLTCNHCATNKKMPVSCPSCRSANLRISGITTDRVKHLTENLFPGKKILVLEKETADLLKIDHRKLVAIAQKADIIIGTFYLTKSALPKADLVGIVCADQSLSLPDFRAQEKTFSHLLQIIRLGKSAVVQTFTPDHAIMQSLAKNSYENFYSHEITDRKNLGYPPFTKLIRFIYQDTSKEKARTQAAKLYRTLKHQIQKENISAEILGPSPAFYQKIGNRFRYHLVLKIKSSWQPNLPKLDKGWIIDVDPANML